MFQLKKVIKTSYSPSELPEEEYAEIVVGGRSNVGKSSFINSLFVGEKPARVSKKPGKTCSLNFYLTDRNFVLVDSPGYGYAERSKKETANWKNLMEGYLFRRKNIKLFILLVDARRNLQEEELLLINTLSYFKIKTLLVLTKCDKLNKGKEIEAKKKAEKLSGLKTITFSARDGRGKWDIIKEIMEAVKE